MTSILKSMLETYLLDEEMDFESVEQQEVSENEERTQYPIGFFSSL